MEGRKKITFTVYESNDYYNNDKYFEPGTLEVFEALKQHFMKKKPGMSEEEATSHALNEAIYETANIYLGEENAEKIFFEAREARRAKEQEAGNQEYGTPPSPE